MELEKTIKWFEKNLEKIKPYPTAIIMTEKSYKLLKNSPEIEVINAKHINILGCGLNVYIETNWLFPFDQYWVLTKETEDIYREKGIAGLIEWMARRRLDKTKQKSMLDRERPSRGK